MLAEDFILLNRDKLDLENVLSKQQLSEEILSKLVDYVNLNVILKTQRLSLDFCVKYILNPMYHKEDTETTISPLHVQMYQDYPLLEINEHIRQFYKSVTKQ